MLRAIALGAALLAAASSAQAAGTACPRPSQPAEVRVTPQYGSVVYDLGRSRQEIASMGSRGGLGHNANTRGLTLSELRLQFQARLARAEVRGGVCVWPVAVEAEVGFGPITVLVDRAYPRGSCQHQVVLAHELEHVRNKQEPLQRHLPRLAGALEGAVRSGSFPVFARSYAEAEAAAMSFLDRSFKPAFNALQSEMRALDARLDDPASIRTSQTACPSW